MIRIPTLALVAALLGACATVPATPDVPNPAVAPSVTGAADGALAGQLDSIARAAFPADAPGAAVLVRRGNDVLLRAGYGMANLELGVPVQPGQVFRIGSVTKQFTAAAVLRLAEQGKLSLDDEITRFLPDWPTHGHRITVASLLDHTSGITSYTGLPQWRGLVRQDLTLDSLLALFRDQPMAFAPGERWEYNNSAYVLLGAVIEKASGRSYEDYVEQELFAPLQLEHTRYGRVEELVPGLVDGYQRIREGWAPAAYLSLTQPYAAGSLLSSVDDLDRWIGALKDGRVLSPASLERAWTAGRLRSGLHTTYGFGWFVSDLYGERSIEHSGGIHGFSSYQLWLPGPDLRVFVLANSQSPPRSPGALAQELARVALGLREPETYAVSPTALPQYVGVYRLEPQPRDVIRRGDTLFTRTGNADYVALRAVARDEFVIAGSQNRLIFERPTGGPVIGVRYRPRIGPEARGVRTAETAVERPAVQLPAAVLDRYLGTYQLTPDIQLVVTRDGDRLLGEPTGQPQRVLRAHSETEFEPVGVDARLVFQVAAGRATGLVLHQGGRATNAPRVR